MNREGIKFPALVPTQYLDTTPTIVLIIPFWSKYTQPMLVIFSQKIILYLIME